jgi:hypothetical protein
MNISTSPAAISSIVPNTVTGAAPANTPVRDPAQGYLALAADIAALPDGPEVNDSESAADVSQSVLQPRV